MKATLSLRRAWRAGRLLLVVCLLASVCSSDSKFSDAHDMLRSNDRAPGSDSASGDSRMLSTSVGVKLQGFSCVTFDAKVRNALRKAFVTVLSLEGKGDIEVGPPEPCGPGADAAVARRRLLGVDPVLTVDITVNVGVAEKLLDVRRALLQLTQGADRLIEACKVSLTSFGVIVPDDLGVTVYLKRDASRDKLVEAAKKLTKKGKCDYSDCRQCTKDPNCGWCDVKGLCQPGDALGPAQGVAGEPCSLWSFESCGGSACSGFSSCGDCRGDPECGWCEDSCTCEDRHPGDPTSPEFGVCKRGWFHSQGWSKKACPAPHMSKCAAKPGDVPAWVPMLTAKGANASSPGAPPLSEPSSKPNGGLDVNLYPAAFVTQSSMTIIGYTLATFKNMDKIAFRTGVAAELGVSLAAVEIDGVFNGKVPTDEDNAPMKLRRRLLAAATTHGDAIAITFSVGAESKAERDGIVKALDSAVSNTGALLQSLQMSGLAKASAVYLDDSDDSLGASGPSAIDIFGEPDKPKPKPKPKPMLWDPEGKSGPADASSSSGPADASSSSGPADASSSSGPADASSITPSESAPVAAGVGKAVLAAAGAAGGASTTGAAVPTPTATKKKCPFSKLNINSPCFTGNAKVPEKSKCLTSGATPKCMNRTLSYCVLKFSGCRDPACQSLGLAKESKCTVPKCPFSKKNVNSPCYEGDSTIRKGEPHKDPHACRMLGANRQCMAIAKKYCLTRSGCVDDACVKYKLNDIKKCGGVWAVSSAFAVSDQDVASSASMAAGFSK